MAKSKNAPAVDPDDDEWIELERQSPANAELPEVSVRVGRTGARRAITWVSLRRSAAQWVEEFGPMFHVQLGGSQLNKIRLMPGEQGPFKASHTKGTWRISLGHLALWPDEYRPVTAATWKRSGDALILTLPDDFAKATGIIMKPDGKPTASSAPAKAEPQKSWPAKRADVVPEKSRVTPSPEAKALAGYKRPAAPATTKGGRQVVPLGGEPPPGRSALDQRRAELQQGEE